MFRRFRGAKIRRATGGSRTPSRLQGVGLRARPRRLFQQAHETGRVPALGHHLLLDQRERHGDQHQAEQQVTAARDQLQLAVLRVGALERLAGHQVAEPDGGQRDEAEVRAVDERPSLPGGEHSRAQANVADQHEQHEGHGHAWRRRVPLPVRPLVGRRSRSHGRRRRSRSRGLSVVTVGGRRRALSPFLLRSPLLLLLLLTATVAGTYQRHSARRPVRSAVYLAANNVNMELVNAVLTIVY